MDKSHETNDKEAVLDISAGVVNAPVENIDEKSSIDEDDDAKSNVTLTESQIVEQPLINPIESADVVEINRDQKSGTIVIHQFDENPELTQILESHPPVYKQTCLEKGIHKSLPAIYQKEINTLTDDEIINHILEVSPKLKNAASSTSSSLENSTNEEKNNDLGEDIDIDITAPVDPEMVKEDITVASTTEKPPMTPIGSTIYNSDNNQSGKKKKLCQKKHDPELDKYNDPEYIAFGHKSVWKTLLSISAATASSELIKSLYVFVDGLFIASNGSDALSALSNISHIEALWQVLGGWLSIGGNAAISSLVAKHEYHLAEFVISSVFIYSIIIAILIAAFVIPFNKDIIMWVLGNDKPGILEQASAYIVPMAACSVILVLYLACGGIVQGLGYSKIYSMVSIICVILNCAVFLPIFISWLNIGIIGAAWACIICQGIGVLIYIGFFIWMNKNPKCHVKFRPFLLFYYKQFLAKRGLKLPEKPKYTRPKTITDKNSSQRAKLTHLEKQALKDERGKVDTRGSVTFLLICVGAIDGIAAASAVAVTSIATVFVNKIASDSRSDEESLVITSMWTACLRIASLATSIMIGFSQAQLSLSAYAYSSRRFKRLIEIFKKSGITMVSASAFITVLIQACADVIPYMFALEDASADEFFKVTPTALRIFSATIFISGAQYVCCAHCQAVNMVARGLLLAVFTQLVFGPMFFIIIYYITEAIGVKNPIDQFYYCLISYNLNDVVSIIVGVIFLTKPMKVLSRLIKWQDKVKKYCLLTGKATSGEEATIKKINEKHNFNMV